MFCCCLEYFYRIIAADTVVTFSNCLFFSLSSVGLPLAVQCRLFFCLFSCTFLGPLVASDIFACSRYTAFRINDCCMNVSANRSAIRCRTDLMKHEATRVVYFL